MRSGSEGKAEISLPFLSPSALLSWRKDHSRAPTRGKMKRECVCRSDALCLDAEAFCVPVGIGAVSEDLGVPFPGAQKAERNIPVAGRKVRHASQKPLAPMLAGERNVLRRFAVKHSGFIPHGRNFFQKLEPGLADVIFRIIRKHLQRT